MREKDNIGFTLVELLAVIVILAIILAIAIPSISSVISNASKASFESDAKMILKALYYKSLNDDTFNLTTVNETNVESVLNVDDSNYKSLVVKKINNEPYIIITGKNKWDNLVVSGDSHNIQVHEGLVLWYDFMNKTNSDADKATATDLSGGAHNGSLLNFGFTSTSGYNSGLVFDGTDDYINIGDIGLSSMTNATVSFWRKTNNTTQWLLLTGQTTGHYIMATGGTTSFYHLNVGGSSAIYVDGVSSNLPKTDNVWHYYVITNVNLSSWTTLKLSNYTGYQYNNYLSNLKIYKKSLSVNEISNNYNLEKALLGL